MSEQPRIVTGALVGALLGAAAAYLFFTERGRVVRSQLEPAIDNLSGELARFQRTLQRASGLASEGLRAVQEFQASRQPGYSGGEPH